MLNIMYIGGHEPSLDCPPETAKMSYFPQVPTGTAPENFDVAVFHHVDLFLSAQNQWDSLAKQYILLVDHQAEALLLSHRQNIGKPNIHLIPRNCGNVVFTITLDKIQKIISGLAGNDLDSLLEGNEKDWPDCAIADYLSIGPCVPARMVRKGNYKFMYTHGHPDLLFDLVSDPDELNNLATDQNYKKPIDDLKKQAMKDYDPDLLMLKVIESQQRRLFIKSVPGEMPSWDYIAYQGDEKR